MAIERTTRIALAVASMFLLGCTSPPDDGDRSGGSPEQASQTSEGTSGEWKPWRVSTTPTVVIGESAGEEYELARVGTALRYSQGYVVPTGLPVGIRLYDKEGRFQRWLGRRGEGPGEYRSISGPWVAEGDTVILYDPALRRITYFDPRGDLLVTVPFDPGGSNVVGEERPRIIIGRFSDGSFLTRQTFYPPLPGTPTTDLASSSVRFFREVPAIGLRDTITTVIDMDMAFEVEPGNRFGAWVSVPFTPTAGAVPYDSALIVANNRRFELLVWSFEGKLISRFSKEYEVVPITDDVWAGELDRRLQSLIERVESSSNRFNLNVQSESAATRRRFLEEKRLPSLPVYGRRMLVDADRNIWIEAWSNDQTEPAAEWHVFSAESERFVGTVEMPPQFRPTAIYTDAVVGIHKDSLDVESVREYPIIR